MASPQSEVSLRGTGMSRIVTPPFLRCFSADKTWCVPRKIRIISGNERRPNGTPPEPAVRMKYSLYSECMTPNGEIFGPAQLADMAWIGGLALAVNLPLGYLREGTRKLSLAWFFFVHLSVPVIAWLRIRHQVSAWAIPPFIACALLGQIAGGRMRRILRKRR